MNKAVMEENFWNLSFAIMSWFIFITLSLQSIATNYKVYHKSFTTVL